MALHGVIWVHRLVAISGALLRNRSWNLQPRRPRTGFVMAVLVALAAALPQVGIAGDVDPEGQPSEDEFRKLADAVADLGAIGQYWDKASNEFVVVLPSDVEPPAEADTDQPHRFTQAAISAAEFARMGDVLKDAAKELRSDESFGVTSIRGVDVS